MAVSIIPQYLKKSNLVSWELFTQPDPFSNHSSVRFHQVWESAVYTHGDVEADALRYKACICLCLCLYERSVFLNRTLCSKLSACTFYGNGISYVIRYCSLGVILYLIQHPNLPLYTCIGFMLARFEWSNCNLNIAPASSYHIFYLIEIQQSQYVLRKVFCNKHFCFVWGTVSLWSCYCQHVVNLRPKQCWILDAVMWSD